MNHRSARGKSKAPAGIGEVAGFPGTCDPRERRESCRRPRGTAGKGRGIKRWKRRFADGGRADLFGSLSLLRTRAPGAARLRYPPPTNIILKPKFPAKTFIYYFLVAPGAAGAAADGIRMFGKSSIELPLSRSAFTRPLLLRSYRASIATGRMNTGY